ncbi:hypothetical protein V7148_11405 [Gottfriedia acidiceleris]|uniref:hypothetical protein n=1 Tax=Gottfriedia acidiceleris TaxID=371036 RepID=UPI002FFE73ED
MTYLCIVNVERIEAVPFTVIEVYDDRGYLSDQTILPFESYENTVDLICDELYAMKQTNFEVWTSGKELFTRLLGVPGVNAQIKHRDDTNCTLYAILQHQELLTDLYEIKTVIPKPKLSKWRKWLILFIEKSLQRLKGDGKYEI